MSWLDYVTPLPIILDGIKKNTERAQQGNDRAYEALVDKARSSYRVASVNALFALNEVDKVTDSGIIVQIERLGVPDPFVRHAAAKCILHRLQKEGTDIYRQHLAALEKALLQTAQDYGDESSGWFSAKALRLLPNPTPETAKFLAGLKPGGC